MPHHHSLVYYALRYYGSFLSFSSIFIVDRKCYYYHYDRHIIHQSPTTTITSCSFLFLLFYIVTAVAVIPTDWTNLKKVNSKEKKVPFFLPRNPKPVNLQTLHSLYRLNIIIDSTSLVPSFIRFLGGLDYSTIASCKLKRKIQPLELSYISLKQDRQDVDATKIHPFALIRHVYPRFPHPVFLSRSSTISGQNKFFIRPSSENCPSSPSLKLCHVSLSCLTEAVLLLIPP